MKDYECLTCKEDWGGWGKEKDALLKGLKGFPVESWIVTGCKQDEGAQDK